MERCAAWAANESRNCEPSVGRREEPIGRFVKTLVRRECIRQMSNQLTGRPVDLAALEIIDFLSAGRQNGRAADDRHMLAVAVVNISVHGSLAELHSSLAIGRRRNAIAPLPRSNNPLLLS
jgi:hypothetical protein